MIIERNNIKLLIKDIPPKNFKDHINVHIFIDIDKTLIQLIFLK